MGFWCAQGTVWVRRQATLSLLLYTGATGELPCPGDNRPAEGQPLAGSPHPHAQARPLTSELQGAEGSMGLQGEEVEGTVEPSSHNPERKAHQLGPSPRQDRLRSAGSREEAQVLGRVVATPSLASVLHQ